jgi:hypothetical protein
VEQAPPDLLVRSDLVEEIAAREGWEEVDRRRWESLRKDIVGCGAKHLDLVYASPGNPVVVAVIAYTDRSASESAIVNPALPHPILAAVADVRVHLDRAVHEQ